MKYISFKNVPPKTLFDFYRGILVEIVSRHKSKVEANITADILGNDDVRGEIIIGNIGIYLKVDAPSGDFFSVHVMLDNRAKKDDNNIYSCKMTSQKLEMVNQRFICDDSQWRVILPYKDIEFGANYKFDLSIEADILEMNSPLAVLHDDTELTDFELCGADGSVRYHSAVLASASPVLRQMLTGQWAETKSRSLQLQDTSKETLQHFKDYLYLNVLPSDGVENLLLLASYYLMTELEKKCVNKLLINVTAQSSSELMKFALTHKLMNLYYGFLKLVQSGAVTIDEKME